MKNRPSNLLYFINPSMSCSVNKLALLCESKGVCYYKNNEEGKQLFGVSFLNEDGNEELFYPSIIMKVNNCIAIYEVIETSEVPIRVQNKALGLHNFIQYKQDNGVCVEGGLIRANNSQWFKYNLLINEWIKIDLF